MSRTVLLPVNMCSLVPLKVMPLDTQYLCCILQGFTCSAVPHVQHRTRCL